MLLIAGLATWLVVGSPLALDAFTDQIDVATGRYITWLIAYGFFGFLFYFVASKRLDRWPLRYQLIPIAVMTGLASYMQFVGPQYFLSAVLFILVISLVSYLLPLKAVLSWLAVQIVLLFVLNAIYFPHLATAFIQTLIFSGFQIFALFTTTTAVDQRKAKDELALAHAELKATQHFLTENSRLHERMRISRDLHDLLGHHLTALSLNLEAASYLAEGKVLEKVELSQSIASSLLKDVREVVTDLRDDNEIDLNAVLTELIKGVPSMTIHLDIPKDANYPSHIALVLLRSAQEFISNSAKHVKASEVWLTIEETDKITLKARDNGPGITVIKKGNGLKGMQERFEAYGGELTIMLKPQQGFQLEGWLPHA